jgi:hypothetical protein
VKISNTGGEIHIFILWESLASLREAVLHELGERFKVLRVFRVHWTRSLFARNLSRFYGQRLPPGCHKESTTGTGPFTLVVVRDPKPVYELRHKNGHGVSVNLNTFELKNKYRSVDGELNPIHASDTAQEARHDLSLLLGIGEKELEMFGQAVWDGQEDELFQDPVGTRGWESLDQFFSVLNETLSYVVLRNFESFPDRYFMGLHGDIDLLVSDFNEGMLVSNAQKISTNQSRVDCEVSIAGQLVPFDFRFVGDGYFDHRWQKEVLADRQNFCGVFVPSAKQHFFTLLYHSLVHKTHVSTDYQERLQTLSAGLKDVKDEVDFSDRKEATAVLRKFMRSSGYRFTRPQDPSVLFDGSLSESWIMRLIAARRKCSRAEFEEKKNPDEMAEFECQRSSCEDLILEALDIDGAHKVLQVGFNDADVTKRLVEKGAQVTILEPNSFQARAAFELFSESKAVRIAQENFMYGDFESGFDLILFLSGVAMVGVVKNDERWSDCFFHRIQELMSDSGRLILAADNPISLRYLNGCRDAIGGVPFFGLNDLYGVGDRTSLGLVELREKLSRAGLLSSHAFGLFPDIKTPRLLITEKGFASTKFNVPDLLIHYSGKDYPETRRRLFSEPRAWRVLARNGLMLEHANGFLLVAAKISSDNVAPDWLAKAFNRSPRRPEFQVATSFFQTAEGGVEAIKERLHPELPAELRVERFSQKIDCAPYCGGGTLLGDIHALMSREAPLREVLVGFSPWVDFLLNHSCDDAEMKLALPPNFVDCIPANLVRGDDGSFRYFDAEWALDSPVPFYWVLARGVYDAVAGTLQNRRLEHLTVRELVRELSQFVGLDFSESDETMACELEGVLKDVCYGDSSGEKTFRQVLDGHLPVMQRHEVPVRSVAESLDAARREVVRMKGTVSWRITKPVRFFANLPGRLFRSGGSD